MPRAVYNAAVCWGSGITSKDIYRQTKSTTQSLSELDQSWVQTGHNGDGGGEEDTEDHEQ